MPAANRSRMLWMRLGLFVLLAGSAWFASGCLGLAQVATPPQVIEQSSLLLDAGWRFHTGDDPAWANPAFDDSSWKTIALSKPTLEQGIPEYSGYGWYRLRLSREQLAQLRESNWDLLFSANSVGQLAIYLNGTEAIHTRGMKPHPTMYQTQPLVVHISSLASDGSLLIAVRTWAVAEIGRGLLASVEIGRPALIEEKSKFAEAHLWDQSILATLVSSFLFLCVAGLGATLYLAQRQHLEYLWLAVLCLTVALRGAVETAWGLGTVDIYAETFLTALASSMFLAATLQFVLLFTGKRHRGMVGVAQVATVSLPILQLLHWFKAFEYAALTLEVIFLVLVVWLLFSAWRRGQGEAGVMLLPFFLAATADSADSVLDFAVRQHWVSSSQVNHIHHLGPIQYSTSTASFLVFLGSLVAVILYRFIHISQQEQRSSAEIEAARTVQAMLIPTQLPSTRTFSLDSAYLPINGVGGDFFQALPLKDDSMLIVVGDVSGKGLQAAMNASSLVGALRNELSHDPATVLAHLNQVMLGTSTGSGSSGPASFATCLCARIYPNGKMTIANAGHLSPYRDGREMELAPDLPLGIIPNMTYEQVSVDLKPGDRLIFLSDGVVEAANPKGELFGFERTQQVSHEPARFIAQTAQRFGQTDDITVVSLYFVPA